jgi:hypothetical protein
MYVMSDAGMYGCMTCKSGNTVKVKAAGAWSSHPYHLQLLTVSKSGNLDILEPSGPVWA